MYASLITEAKFAINRKGTSTVTDEVRSIETARKGKRGQRKKAAARFERALNLRGRRPGRPDWRLTLIL